MTHYLPMLLMFLAASSRTSSSSSAATPKPSGGGTVRAKPPAVTKPKQAAATKPAGKTPAKPAVKPPATAEEAAAQAAVNAVIVDAIKRQVDTGVAMAQAPAAAAKPALTIDVPKRSPAEAAAALRDFLRRTHKYGSKKAPVPEVKAAQADMGSLTVDGIVGPKTRARAKALGVTLP